MPNIEGIKRKAQNAVYTATERAQEAAAAAAAAAGGKAGVLKEYASEKAGVLKDYAGEKASSLKDTAKTGVTIAAEKRSLEKNYQALGEWYAASCGDHVPEAVADIVQAIHASQERIRDLRLRGAEE